MFNICVAEFEKVSFERYLSDWFDIDPLSNKSEDEVRAIYDAIRLPSRGTKGSVGYDFYMPFDVKLVNPSNIIIPTGIRCNMCEGWGLFLFPRSGQGFKYGLSLANTIGVIDNDYYYSDNEGHILVKLCNDAASAKPEDHMDWLMGVNIKQGSGFCQGIFLQCGFVRNECPPDDVRNGGFGSTGA